MDWGEVNPTHAYYNASRTITAMKELNEIQVSRPRELRRQLQLWKRFGRLYLIVFVLFRNVLVQGIVHQCLQQDDMHNDDHGSYDTLIQDQMVMPYGSAFLKVLTLQRLLRHQLFLQQRIPPAVPEQTTVETVTNMTPENRAHYESEKEAIHLILTGIGDEIYSTVDACQTAQEMWEAIERLQQGESLNIQDVKTNLFWEFGQFTSHDGETIESYYTRFYKMMNEMIRNNLTVATMQVNVQFL
ncbi:hypothetical protein Tco_0957072, partial [Tanacetum coccineum]